MGFTGLHAESVRGAALFVMSAAHPQRSDRVTRNGRANSGGPDGLVILFG